MSRPKIVRVIFLNTSLEAGLTLLSPKTSSQCLDIQSGAVAVSSLLLTNIKTLFPETQFMEADIVKAAIMLSNPDQLKELAGKTIIIADPPEESVQTLANTWSLTDVLEVQFFCGRYDDRFKLCLRQVTAGSFNNLTHHPSL
jgi:hypothetical protein